jgi:hypothetical protein
MSRIQAKSPEGYVQSAILDYLAAKHVLAYRMNTGAVKLESRLVRFGVKGMADIIAFPTRCSVPAVLWIEVKSATGKQSPEQKSFEAQVRKAGHAYVVARFIDDVEGYL